MGTPVLTGVSCPSPEDCVAVGPGESLTSTDGGSSWITHELADPSDLLLAVVCPTLSNCVAVGTRTDTVGGIASVALSSADGGVTWSEEAVPAPDEGGLGGVACATPTFCVAVGSAVAVSDNGGETWSPRAVNGGIEGALRAVTCPTPTTCVAVGPNPAGMSDPSASVTGVITTDTGQTFSDVALPPGSSSVAAVSCVGATSCTAVGSPLPGETSAPSFVSSDLGHTWSSGPGVAAMGGVAALACPGETSCVAVGHTSSSMAAASTSNRSSWQVSTPAASPGPKS